MNSQPNAAQKRWREDVRAFGSVLSGGPAVIHHPVGRTGKHNKVHIGHWWVIPLTDEEHKALHAGSLEAYLRCTRFEGMSRKEFEKKAFITVASKQENPFSSRVFDAIMDYHR